MTPPAGAVAPAITADLSRKLIRSSPELWSYDPPILAGLARGHTKAEIAQTTGTPLGTVQNRILRLRRRLGALSCAHMVAIAYQRGWMAKLPPEPRPPVRLSPRQLAVLEGIAAGMTTHQLAATLDMSKDTAVTHLRRLYTALGASRPGSSPSVSRAHAVALGYQHGHLVAHPLAASHPS
ncbi:response regulator transcription factor [Streptomyces chryseus]